MLNRPMNEALVGQPDYGPVLAVLHDWLAKCFLGVLGTRSTPTANLLLLMLGLNQSSNSRLVV